MKILLINPPRSEYNNIYKYAPQKAKKYIHKKLIGPPLGLLTVASAVKDFNVTVLDLKAEIDMDPNPYDPLITVYQYLQKIKPDIVGVTFITSEFNAGIKIFQTVKRFNPRILTVAGGLHATVCRNDFINTPTDIICPGESAHIFRGIVLALKRRIGLENIGGIYINKDGKFYPTIVPKKQYDSACKDFIMPDRKFIRKWIPSYMIQGKIGPVTYIFTSLGCPYKCSFCSIWPQYEGGFRQRKVESIINELKLIGPEYPVVRFADANTVVHPELINTLCDRILEEGIEKNFVIDIRADTVVNNPKLIEKLAKCGLKVVICGFESYKQEELKKYKKNSTVNQITKAIKILQANDIRIRGNYVVPPSYIEDDFKALAEYSNSHKVVYAGYTILTPMPGTTYYNQVKNNIIDTNLDKYNFFNCVLKTKLSLEKFYENMGKLWLIKKGKDII